MHDADLVVQAMKQEVHSPVSSITANIQGAVSGQLAVGNNIVQIGDVSGGLVYVAKDGGKPTIEARPIPVLMRPRRLRGLMDRENERSVARQAILDGESIELHAEDGFGKTALLRGLAHEISDEIFSDGILFVAANGLPAGDVLQRIFSSFYQSSIPTKILAGELHTYLHSKKAWIILDNFDGERSAIEQIVSALPSTAFLITSCERRLWGDAQSVSLGGLPEDDAILLFERELGRSVRDAERDELKRLCESLDCQPLLILQTASVARTGSESITTLLAKADSSGAIMSHTLAKQSPKRWSILAVLAALGSRLHASQLEEITGLGAEMGPELEALAETHLLNVDHGFCSLAPNTADQIPMARDLTEWKSKGIQYLADWAQLHKGNADELLQHRESLISAMREAVRSGHSEEALQISSALDGTLAMDGLWESWREVSMLSLEAARNTGNQSAEAWALHQLGTRSLCLEDTTQANQLLHEALEIRTEIGDKAGIAATRHNLGLGLVGTPVPNETTDPSVAGGALGSFAKVALLSLGAIIAGVLVYLNLPPQAPKPIVWDSRGKDNPGVADDPIKKNLQILPPEITGLKFKQNEIQGGDEAMGQIALNAPAPAGGFSVVLESDHQSSGNPPKKWQETISEGQKEKQITVKTDPTTNRKTIAITAMSNDSKKQSATLTLTPPEIASLTLSSSGDPGKTEIIAGGKIEGEVVLTGKAPIEGIDVTLSANSEAINLPSGNKVRVPAGENSVPFELEVKEVPKNTPVIVTAQFLRSKKSASFTATAKMEHAPKLRKLTLQFRRDFVTRIEVNQEIQGTVHLDKPATKEITLDLEASRGLVEIQGRIVIRRGKTESLPFPIIGRKPGSEKIVVALNGLKIEKDFIINPLLPRLKTLKLDTKSIDINKSTKGVVTLDKPALKDIAVSLKATNGLVRLPRSVGITRGKTASDSFNITGVKPGTETITALLGGSKAEAQLVINPPPPRLRILRLRARSINVRGRTQGAVSLDKPARKDITVSLKSANSLVSLPRSVEISRGKTVSASFDVIGLKPGTETITALFDGSKAESQLVINRPPALVEIRQVTFKPNPYVISRQGRRAVLSGTVTLAKPAGQDVVIDLITRDATLVNLQKEPLIIRKGKQSGSFVVSPKAAGKAVIYAKIRGEKNPRPKSGTLTITQSKPSLIPSVKITPASVIAGQTVTIEVTTNQPAPKAGWTVLLTADRRGLLAPFPRNLRIGPGARSTKFKIKTSSKIKTSTSVRLTATIARARSRPAILKIRAKQIIK